MPRQIWNAESGLLMEKWAAIVVSAQGKMLTKQEKLELVREKLNEASKENSWGVEYTVEQTGNKLDHLHWFITTCA